MEDEIANKQIPIQTIIDVADYFEEYKNRYLKVFDEEDKRNEGKALEETDYQHRHGEAEVTYTVYLKNGKNMKESDYNWFISYLNNPKEIDQIIIHIDIQFFSKSGTSRTSIYDRLNTINGSIYFEDIVNHGSKARIYVHTSYQEREANNLYYTADGILNDNKERLDKTIKHRKLRIQSFCISVGIILSYIFYAILSLNASKLPIDISTYLTNKYVVVFGQWFLAILLGNIFSYWYIVGIYRPLLPRERYVGYSRSAGKSVYADDLDDYEKHSEIQIGNLWDADKRRKKIEKLYLITRIILLIQLLISAVLYFVMK